MKNTISKLLLVMLLAFAVNMVVVEPVTAQCPMCKMSAESNMKNGGTAGKGLNKGILYLFAAPYLMVGGLGFIWYRVNKKKRDEDEEAALKNLLEN